LKKSFCANVTFLLGRSTKGTWVPSIDLHMFNKLINSWNSLIINFNRFHVGILMYLLKKLFLSMRTLHIMSTYFWIVNAPTLKWWAIWMALCPWVNIQWTIATIFLISSRGFTWLRHWDCKKGVNFNNNFWKNHNSS
jgi:hypothetical protein